LPVGERGKLYVLAAETGERYRQLKEAFTSLQEGIDFDIKYMLFDLEATRRENAELRKMLEHRGNP